MLVSPMATNLGKLYFSTYGRFSQETYFPKEDWDKVKQFINSNYKQLTVDLFLEWIKENNYEQY